MPVAEHESETRPSLLIRIRDAQDRLAWQEFMEIYAPLIEGYARRRGLQPADAADVVQDVLRQVAASIESFEYDRRKTGFRAWLLTITRNRVYNFFSRDNRDRASGDTRMRQRLAQEPSPEDDAEWDREVERRLFVWASKRVRSEFQPSTWQAFWRTAVLRQAASTVAGDLGISVGAVYVAKSRVLARLRQVVESVGGEESFSS